MLSLYVGTLIKWHRLLNTFKSRKKQTLVTEIKKSPWSVNYVWCSFEIYKYLFLHIYMLRHIGSRHLLHNSAFADISFHNTFLWYHVLTLSKVCIKKPAWEHTVTNFIKTCHKNCYFESLLSNHRCRWVETEVLPMRLVVLLSLRAGRGLLLVHLSMF